MPLYQPEKASADDFLKELSKNPWDLGIVVAYGEIIKQHLLDLPQFGMINVHGSLLPKYRGAAPIQRAMMNGERELGVTIMKMVRAMDAGDIIRKISYQPAKEDCFGDVHDKLAHLSCQPLFEVLSELEEHGEVASTPQSEKEVTFAPKITKEDLTARLESAKILCDQIKALSPNPCVRIPIRFEGVCEVKQVKIFYAIPRADLSGDPGTMEILAGQEWILYTKDRSAVALEEVQLEGKKRLPIKEFLRGLSIPFTLDL